MQELGGLGSKEGPLEAYTWVPSSMLPGFLPWLTVLFLLAIKSNRVPSAWWIWAGLAGGLAVQALLRSSISFVPSQPLDAIAQALNCLLFGLAAVWLLAGFLAWKNRFLACLGITAILAGFSGLTFLFSQVMGGEEPELLPTAMILAICLLVVPIGLTLAGLCCRGRYRPGRLSLWLALCLAITSILAMTPFFVIAVAGNASSDMLKEFGVAVLLMAGAYLGAVLPFMLRSYVNPFYLERLQGLLHLDRAAAPPPMVPTPPPDLVAAAHPAG